MYKVPDILKPIEPLALLVGRQNTHFPGVDGLASIRRHLFAVNPPVYVFTCEGYCMYVLSMSCIQWINNKLPRLVEPRDIICTLLGYRMRIIFQGSHVLMT